MAVTDKERKLAATLSDPVLWGQAYLYNRDGSGRDYWPHQVEDLRCPAKNIIQLSRAMFSCFSRYALSACWRFLS